MEYGLIGAKLGHSYSKIIHEAVCGYSYELHPLPTEEEAHAFMQAKAFKAINVTIPYKKLVIPYCDEVEPRAAAIGAVNTVVKGLPQSLCAMPRFGMTESTDMTALVAELEQ